MERREFLKSMALALAGVPVWLAISREPAWGKLPAGIKITQLKTFVVGDLVFVKLYTSEGVTGLGEGSMTGRTLAVQAAIKEQERLLVGRDPTNVELLWQEMFRWPRYKGGPILTSALSALEIALWDLLGKLLDVPIYRLLGGAARHRVRLYTHVYGSTPETIKAAVEGAKAAKYTAVRTGLAVQRGPVVTRPWDLKQAASLMAAVREAAGDNVDILDDAHGMLTPTMVMEWVKAIEPYRMMFLEDPTQPQDLASLKWVGEHTTVPLAIGENLYTKYEFQEIIAQRLISYVRPDAIHAGGIAECKKIGAMAEANFIDMALHVAPSPVSNLAAAHVATCTPNCVIVENTGHTSRRSGWMKDLFMGGDIQIVDGYAALPDQPGLGCDLDEKIAAEHPYHAGDMPWLQWDDGSVSDW